MARHRAATSVWRSSPPRWAFNSVLYAALGFASLGVIQSLGPFNEVQDIDPSFLREAVSVDLDDVSDPDTMVSVEAEVYPHGTGDQRAGLFIAITSKAGFTFEDMRIGASNIQSYEKSPLTCYGAAKTAEAPFTPATPLAFGVETYQPDGQPNPRAQTILRGGGERYRDIRVVCDITSLAKARRTPSEVTYTIPPVSVFAGANISPYVELSLSRSPLDSIVTNSSPPTTTEVDEYIWKPEPSNRDFLIVSVTNPDIRNAREQSVFLWGLFAGVAGAFFVAAIQEVVNRAGRKPSRKPTAPTDSETQSGSPSG